MLQKTFALTERSLRVDARSVSGHLLRLLLAGAVLLALAVLSGEFGAAPGLMLMSVLAYGNAVVITIVGPIYFGSCITEEKEERTLPLLLMADIGPLAILSGKMLPRLLSVLLVLTAQVPFTLLAITLGGVLLDQVLAAYLCIAAYLLAIAGLGTMCSVLFRQSSNAIGAAGLILLMYYVAPAIFWAWGQEAVRVGAGYGSVLVAGSQVVMSTYAFGRLAEILAVAGVESYWSWQVVASVLFGTLTFGVAWATFGHCTRDLDAVPQRKRERKSAAGGGGPKRRPWTWPVVWKEFQFLGGGRRMMIGKAIGYGCIGGLLAFTMSGFGRRFADLDDIAISMLGVMSFAAGLELTLMVARTFSTELKEQTWGTLNMLPYSVSRLAYSKLLGLVPPLIPALAWLLLSLVASGALGEFVRELSQKPAAVLYITATFLGHSLLFLHLVAFYSILLRNSWGGLVAGLLTHYFGSLAAMMFLFLVLQVGTVGTSEGNVLLAANLILPWAVVIGLHLLSLRLLQRDIELR